MDEDNGMTAARHGRSLAAAGKKRERMPYSPSLADALIYHRAWREGYKPPSAHELADALMLRGAKVRLSSQSSEASWWIATNGAIREEHVREMIEVLEIYARTLHRSELNEPRGLSASDAPCAEAVDQSK